MKTIYRAIAILSAAFAFCTNVHAIVAVKTPVTYTQPDGSTITIMLHGDEFSHYATTESGTRLYLHPDGFYKTTLPPMVMNTEQRRLTRESVEQSRLKVGSNSLAKGKHKFLVMLIEFADLKFTVSNPQQAFTNLLNQKAYSANGGTGSARDFYVENSNERFDPEFVVVGPVTLSRSYKYYGGNGSGGDDQHPDEALYEACKIVDSQINFAEFDQDRDGFVDNVFFYYAGHNEAEGASSDTIWPHAWSLYYYNAYFDGVRVYSYACTSEYRGASGSNMCGIGTFCHEFGHVIGLPDFYDTDYSTNGQGNPLDYFSLMDSGGYNNSGRTPPYLNAMERYILGWIPMPETLVYTGGYKLAPVRSDAAYRIDSPNSGEFYLLECRDRHSWDAYSPMRNVGDGGGLLVYHVDQSSNRVGSSTASYLWSSMYSINSYASHMCFYLVHAYNSSSSSNWVFPGPHGVKELSPKSWAGKTASVTLSGISYASGNVNFRASGESGGLEHLGQSYIVLDGSTPRLVSGSGLTVSHIDWSQTESSITATVTYTNGSTEVIELEKE